MTLSDTASWAEVELASRGGLNTAPESLLNAWQASLDHSSTTSAALDVAWRVADTLRRKGHAATALQVTGRASTLEAREPERLLLAGTAAVSELDISGLTDHLRCKDLARLMRGLVAAADNELTGGGDEHLVADLAGLALEVACHPSRYTDVEVSPLADLHDALLEVWHASAVRRHLDTVTGQRSEVPVAAGTSVIAVTWAGASFLPPLAEVLSSAGATVSSIVVEPNSWLQVGPVRDLVRTRLAQVDGRVADGSPPASVVAAVAAADTVVVDWCDHVAVCLPAILRDEQRLVVRLHGDEALSAEAQLVPWHRVDQLIVVSGPLRRLVAAALPQARQVPIKVVPSLAVTLGPFGGPKPHDAWRTLALVDWERTVDDAQFVLDVLESLRVGDPSWRLLLVREGATQSPKTYAAADSEELIRRVMRLESENALELIEHVGDLAPVLSRTGFIFSTFTRESCHAALVEGVAVGTVPVVRDWPLLKEYGGASEVLHADWVVGSVEGARARILDLADPSRAAAAGRAARDYVASEFGPDRVARATSAAVLGEDWMASTRTATTAATAGTATTASTARTVRRAAAVAGDPKRLTALLRRRMRSAGKGTVRRLGTESVLENPGGALLWRYAVRAPGIPAADRIKVARNLANRLVSHGRESGAADLLEAASRRLSTSDRARLRTESALILLQHGLDTPARMSASVQASLAAADIAWQARQVLPTAAHLADAFAVAFHRVLHFDRSTSPLAADPAGYLAPFRESSAFAHASRSDHRLHQATDRPTRRLLVASYVNFNFTTPIIERYQGLDDVEVRRLDVKSVTPGQLPQSVQQLARARLLAPSARAAMPYSERIVEEVSWSDVAFIDWSQRAAVLITSVDPGTTRVIVRLHSYEAFTCFPHLVDWSRVDDVVFVGRHLQQLAARIVTDLPARQHVLPVLMELRRMKRQKVAEARTTLAVLGWSAPAKDAIWAIEVLAELRRHDPSYRLLLVGAGPGESAPAAVLNYVASVRERASRPDVADGVQFVAQTDDVPGLLVQVGTILSSSVRESFHAAVAEGAASGAVPVVRDWPFFVPYGGAAAVYPEEWIVQLPADAARRILQTTQEEATWRAEGLRAQEHALSTFDQSVTGPRYDDLFGLHRVGTA